MNRGPRNNDLRHRIREEQPTNRVRCAVAACRRFTQKSSGSGLSPTYCANHVEHIRRHGHSRMKTPSRAALQPFVTAARDWLRQNGDTRRAASILASLNSMLRNAGRPISAYDLRGKTLQARAENVMARYREAGKTGADLLVVVLALRGFIAKNGPRAAPDYLRTQVAKLMHRVSSGTNRTTSGFRMPRKNPRPEGRFMVHLGKRVYELASIVADEHAIEEVLRIVEEASSRSRD